MSLNRKLPTEDNPAANLSLEEVLHGDVSILSPEETKAIKRVILLHQLANEYCEKDKTKTFKYLEEAISILLSLMEARKTLKNNLLYNKFIEKCAHLLFNIGVICQDLHYYEKMREYYDILLKNTPNTVLDHLRGKGASTYIKTQLLMSYIQIASEKISQQEFKTAHIELKQAILLMDKWKKDASFKAYLPYFKNVCLTLQDLTLPENISEKRLTFLKMLYALIDQLASIPLDVEIYFMLAIEIASQGVQEDEKNSQEFRSHLAALYIQSTSLVEQEKEKNLLYLSQAFNEIEIILFAASSGTILLSFTQAVILIAQYVLGEKLNIDKLKDIFSFLEIHVDKLEISLQPILPWLKSNGVSFLRQFFVEFTKIQHTITDPSIHAQVLTLAKKCLQLLNDSILVASPPSVDLFLTRAEVHFYLNNLHEAKLDYLNALKKDPTNSQIQARLLEVENKLTSEGKKLIKTKSLVREKAPQEMKVTVNGPEVLDAIHPNRQNEMLKTMEIEIKAIDNMYSALKEKEASIAVIQKACKQAILDALIEMPDVKATTYDNTAKIRRILCEGEKYKILVLEQFNKIQALANEFFTFHTDQDCKSPAEISLSAIKSLYDKMREQNKRCDKIKTHKMLMEKLIREADNLIYETMQAQDQLQYNISVAKEEAREKLDAKGGSVEAKPHIKKAIIKAKKIDRKKAKQAAALEKAKALLEKKAAEDKAILRALKRSKNKIKKSQSPQKLINLSALCPKPAKNFLPEPPVSLSLQEEMKGRSADAQRIHSAIMGYINNPLEEEEKKLVSILAESDEKSLGESSINQYSHMMDILRLPFLIHKEDKMKACLITKTLFLHLKNSSKSYPDVWKKWLLQEDKFNFTPLHEVLQRGYLENVQIYCASLEELIKEGTLSKDAYRNLLTQHNHKDLSPLQCAINSGCFAIFELFINLLKKEFDEEEVFTFLHANKGRIGLPRCSMDQGKDKDEVNKINGYLKQLRGEYRKKNNEMRVQAADEQKPIHALRLFSAGKSFSVQGGKGSPRLFKTPKGDPHTAVVGSAVSKSVVS